MNKNIKDYLHLYFGGECKLYSPNYDGKLFKIDSTSLTLASIEGYSVKPILRPLSDMTEEETMEIAKIVCGDQFVEPKFISCQQIETVSSGLTIQRLSWSAYQVIKHIDDKPEVFIYHITSWGSINVYFSRPGMTPTEMGNNEKSIPVVFYLLSKHFDLFSLIESGLAIDKTA